jgi:hypothetical protein
MPIIGHFRQTPLRRSGVMLAECLLALTILPLAVIAVAYAVTAGQAQSIEALHQARATALADGLMEEILSLPYEPSTDDALGAEEANRWQFDSPTDYDGFTEAAGSISQVDRVNDQLVASPDSLQGFSRSVDVTFCECGAGGPDACPAALCETFSSANPIAAKILTATVAVSDEGGDVTTLQRVIIEAPAGGS